MQISKKALVLVLISVLLVLGVGGSFYFGYKYQKTKSELARSGIVSNQEIDETIKRVGRLIELPEGEEPTVATVKDMEKLAGQPFFAKAKNGYKVLIYTNARIAIIYNPVNDKLVNVAPLNIMGGEARLSDGQARLPDGQVAGEEAPVTPIQTEEGGD